MRGCCVQWSSKDWIENGWRLLSICMEWMRKPVKKLQTDVLTACISLKVWGWKLHPNKWQDIQNTTWACFILFEDKLVQNSSLITILCLRSSFASDLNCHRASRDLMEHISLWDKLRDVTNGSADLTAFNTYWRILDCDNGQNMRSHKSVIKTKNSSLLMSCNEDNVSFLY
jgi:hypothetical protein